MNRLLLAALFVAAFSLPSFSQESFDPATLMPADTVLYGEVDAAAAVRGFVASDVMRILYADEFKSFFGPIREKAPDKPEDIVKPMLDYVKGRAAVGISGIALRMRKFDGTYESVRIAPDAPVNADLLRKMLRTSFMPWRSVPIILDFEGVAVIEPGPELRKRFNAFLENPPMPFKHKFVQRGARQILEIEFEPFQPERDGPYYAPHFYADMTGDRWIIATSPALLATAAAKQGGMARRTSLATDVQFAEQRARHTSGERLAFLYADVARLWKMAKPVLPPAGYQFLDEEGLGSVRALCLGMSSVEGGARESFGIALRENPQGIWRMLDAMAPGLESVKKAPARTRGIIAAKFDAKLFMQRLDEWLGQLVPGAEAQVRGFWARGALAVGLDLERDIVDAIGDETALLLYPPGAAGLPIPDLALDVAVRDEKAFRGFIMKMQVLLAGTGLVRLDPKKMRDDVEGWQLFWTAPMNAPKFRIHEGHFIGSTNPLILRRWIADWAGPEKTLRKDNEVFAKVMMGLNGGDVDSLCALVYGDIRSYLPVLVSFAAGMGALDEDMFNSNPMPDLKKMASMTSGFALGLRRDKQGIVLDSFGPGGMLSGFMSMVFLFVREVAAIGVPVPVR